MRGKLKKTGLTSKILIALLSGAVLGISLNYLLLSYPALENYVINGLLYLIGQGFIRLMQMLVVPLVFCSLVCGSMSIGDTKKLGNVGVQTLLFYLVTTALAIAAALFIGQILQPGTGLNMNDLSSPSPTAPPAKAHGFAETLLTIIPANIFHALSEGIMLPIILFSLLVGIILAKLGEPAKTVSSFFQQFNEIMMQMTLMIMRLAPYGVFCLIARTFAGIGLDAALPLLKYMLAVLFSLFLHCFIIYLGLLKAFTGLNPILFIKKFFPVMAFAFSTATSNAAIPMSIDTLDSKMGISRKISSFTIPLGATINMDGTAIMQGVAVAFAAQAFGISLTLPDYLTVIGTATLASIGTAGIPGVGLITLTMVFESVGLPVEAIALIMGIDRILDMARTSVNITGDAVCTAIVASRHHAVNRSVYYEK